jgi:hypothetical protein
MKSFWLVSLVAALVVAALAFTAPPSSATSPVLVTPETLKQFEADFMKAAAEKGSAGYMSYYADDAVEVPNGGPLKHCERHGLPRRQEQQPDLDAGGRGYFCFGRSWLHLRHVRVPLARQRRQAGGRAWQVHQHLEEAERRQLESSSRHGERQLAAEMKCVGTGKSARPYTNCPRTNSFASIPYASAHPETRAESGTRLIIRSFAGVSCRLFLRALHTYVESISYGPHLRAKSNPLRIIEFAFACGVSCIALRYKPTAGHFPAVLAQFSSRTTFGPSTMPVVAPARFQAPWQRF